jgi:hypothetical protein
VARSQAIHEGRKKEGRGRPAMRSRVAIIVAAVAILTAGFIGTGSAATSIQAHYYSHPVPAPYPGAVFAPNSAAGAVPLTSVIGGRMDPDACFPAAEGDNVHLSGGYASGHGWWAQGTCQNVKATVTVILYEYFSDGLWHYQATGSAFVYPGGGSGNRATVRQFCEGVALAGWRTYISVAIGAGDSTYTPNQNLNCTNPSI